MDQIGKTGNDYNVIRKFGYHGFVGNNPPGRSATFVRHLFACREEARRSRRMVLPETNVLHRASCGGTKRMRKRFKVLQQGATCRASQRSRNDSRRPADRSVQKDMDFLFRRIKWTCFLNLKCLLYLFLVDNLRNQSSGMVENITQPLR